MSVLHHIEALIADVPHQRIVHDPIATARDAAVLRGTPLAIGGKSLVMKFDGVFGVFVISSARRSQGNVIRKFLGARRMRFATREELLVLTGLTPGCVPPLGRPIFDLPLYVDQSIADNAQIAFSAGSHTVSVVMAVPDYLAIARPDAVFSFASPVD
ncbi:MAG: Ala-tRNA(Pro) deacylase [Myxococcota bacterium]|jgi:Ala-tRNA(Pro) deacylase